MDIETTVPELDAWLREAKELECAGKIGMYLLHNGVVRGTAKEQVRYGQTDVRPVTGMAFSYNRECVRRVLEEAGQMEGIYHVRLWLNEGKLQVGDDIMFLLVGGDIRPHVVEGLQYIVGRIKTECITEQELYD